jgi:hypothetical protein
MKYLFIAFVFFSCAQNSNDKAGRKYSTEQLDTIQTAPLVIAAVPALFETAFIKGTKQKIKRSELELYGITIGNLKVVSGRIVACDPLHIEEYGKPYTQVFPTGDFPVQLSIARWQETESIAFARIKFSNEPVARWAFALQEGQEPMPITGSEMHGFSVDAGVGIFLDEAASKALDKSKVADMDREMFKEMEKHFHNTWRYTMYQFGNHNLAAFSTGVGDGFFGTYIGYDAKGVPCRLLSDFNLFDWRSKNN